MKRFLCVLTACLMIVPVAMADDLEEFNMYAEIFGGTQISGGSVTENEKGVFTQFNSEGCQIIFMNENGSLKTIYVLGSGEAFLTYAAAAMMVCDPDSEHARENLGAILLNYYLARGSGITENQVGYNAAGQVFGVNREDETNFRFMVIK